VIVDTSALLAVLLDEKEADVFSEVLAKGEWLVSAVSFVEASIIAESKGGGKAEISIEPGTEEHALAARQAYSDYGKGRHLAGLDLGDCFSYALAKVSGEPFLFKGSDFRKTYVKAAS